MDRMLWFAYRATLVFALALVFYAMRGSWGYAALMVSLIVLLWVIALCVANAIAPRRGTAVSLVCVEVRELRYAVSLDKEMHGTMLNARTEACKTRYLVIKAMAACEGNGKMATASLLSPSLEALDGVLENIGGAIDYGQHADD